MTKTLDLAAQCVYVKCRSPSCCFLLSFYRLSVLVCHRSGPLLGLNLRRPSIRALVEFLRAVCFWSAWSSAKNTLRPSWQLYSPTQVSSQLDGLDLVIRWTLWRDAIHLLHRSKLLPSQPLKQWRPAPDWLKLEIDLRPILSNPTSLIFWNGPSLFAPLVL